MKKRLISLFFTVLMMLSLFSAFSVSVNAAGAINFEYNPTVLVGGGTDYVIIWKNNVNSIGYVTYTYNGKTYTAYDQEDGVVRSDDCYHTVRIPMEHLNNASKIVATAKVVTGRNGFNITLGASAEKTVPIKVWKGGDFRIGSFSDPHIPASGNKPTLDRCVFAKENYMKDLHLVLLLGDISTVSTSQAYLDNLLDISAKMGADGTPVLYVKGNHECRGEWSQMISRYFKYDTEECFGSFEMGPISGIITDCGEDKIDSHMEYGDQNGMEHYKAEQYEYLLANGQFSEDSLYHISLSHSHNLVDAYYTQEIVGIANELGVDLHINGHTHTLNFSKAGGDFNFPRLHDGGHNNDTTMRTTMITLSGANIFYKGFSDEGETLIEGSTPVVHGKAAKGVSVEEFVSNKEAAVEEVVEAAPVVEEEEEEVVEAAAAVEDETIPTAAGVAATSLRASASSIAITVKPTVFDAGKYYNVVWQTTPGIKACGDVELSLGSTKVLYKDTTGGKARTDTTHSVRIPKTTFGVATYEAKSRLCIRYTSGGYVNNPPTEWGPYVSAGKIKFNGEPGPKQKSYKILAVANLGNVSYAEKVKAEIGSSKPDILVTAGDMVNAINTEDDFKNYLKMTQAITGGQYPVMYLRGEGECTGAYAANVGRFIRNATEEMVVGKFYLNSAFGELALIGLDTALEEADTTAKYNGYAAFDSIRKEQVTWLKEKIPPIFKSTYNIVFAHADNLSDVCGVNMAEGLADLGTNLIVTGQSGKAAFSNGQATIGSPSGDNTYGLMLNCADNKIEVKVVGGDEIGSVECETVVKPDSNKPGNNNPSTPGDTSDPEDTTPGDTSDPEDTTPGNQGTTTTPGGNTGSSGSTGGTTQTVPGEFDGVTGDVYIRQIKEGWYKDFLSNGFSVTSSKPTAVGSTLTDAKFIEAIAKLASANLHLYTGSSTEKAAAWAKECGIYTAYITGATVTNTIVNAVMTALFPTAE